jgi:hypothetical protein
MEISERHTLRHITYCRPLVAFIKRQTVFCSPKKNRAKIPPATANPLAIEPL